MPLEPSQPIAEREKTDESLRVERDKADDPLGERPTLIEAAADAVISKARSRADAVLATARARTDDGAATLAIVARSPKSLTAQRRLEDQVVRAERIDADDALRAERAERALGLASERAETDRDLLRERALADRAVATRDEFLALVSHDLRNMLGVIVGFAVLVEKEASHDSRSAKTLGYAQRIQRASGRMNRLIGDLVDVASIEAGALAVVLEDVELPQLVSEAVDTFREQAATSGISLTAEAVPTPSRVRMDPARILQVLVNLLSNALKFTPRGGAVGVRAECVGHELRFSVHDTGIGISADKLEAVFARFVQVGPVNRSGVGLGLYISRCIVEAHGGRIWAESRVGEGCTLRFTLPHEA